MGKRYKDERHSVGVMLDDDQLEMMRVAVFELRRKRQDLITDALLKQYKQFMPKSSTPQ